MSELFFGQCRCCLAEGSHRDAKEEYYENGTREVYYDMFVSCFNLHLCHNISNTLICSSCIQQLRVASEFRARVLDSELKLINAFKNRTLFIEVQPLELKEREVDIKVEIVSDDVKQESFVDDDSRLSLVHREDDREALVSGEAELLARFRAGSLRPLPTRSSLYSICGAYVTHLDHLRGKNIPSKKILKHTKCSKSKKKVYLTEKLSHVANVSTLLENSNITPFKSRHGVDFQCFYCRKICENLRELRDHQSKEKKTSIKRLSLSNGVDGLVINVDVTDLKCTLCDKEIENLNTLKAHLINEHKKEWHSHIEDRVIPFKLNEENSFECQICRFTFETFVSIERHMNVHFRNYVCECGAGFMTKHRLKVHMKTVHQSGTFPCDLCKKMFNTAYKYRIHVDAVHKKAKRSKCPKCFERFSDCHKRQKHMVVVHGSAPLVFKCNVCDKSYSRRYQLTCHLKRSHLKEKEIQCQMCSYMCCTNSELNKHMVSHEHSKSFQCDVCKKSYARKKTLKEHMRIHNNDRRFTCAVCGQAFVQNCSLKGHMKTHHPEFVT